MVPCHHVPSHPVSKPWIYLGLLNAVIPQAFLSYLQCLFYLLKQPPSLLSQLRSLHYSVYPVSCLQSDLPEVVFSLGSKARTSLKPEYQVQTCLTFKVLIICLYSPSQPYFFFYCFLKCILYCFGEGDWLWPWFSPFRRRHFNLRKWAWKVWKIIKKDPHFSWGCTVLPHQEQ